MVAKSDILTARREIEEALGKFIHERASSKVYVFETEGQHLRALIGSGGFEGVGLSERQDMVWLFLRDEVMEESLAFLVAVHPMDLDEYDRTVQEF